jgi:hypothetical protein
MIKFKDQTGDKRIQEAIGKANKLFEAASTFFDEIKRIEDFDQTSITGTQLVEEVIKVENNKQPDLEVHVKPYNSTNTKATAYFTSRQPDSIYVNSAKFKRSVYSLVNTLVHELMHVLDHRVGRYEFGHGSNDRTGKENTVPYKVGYLAYVYAKKNLASSSIALTNSSLSAYEAFLAQPSEFELIVQDKPASATAPLAPPTEKDSHLVKNITLTVFPNSQESYLLNLAAWGREKGFSIAFKTFDELYSFYKVVSEIEDLEIKEMSDNTTTTIKFEL